jgi:DNA-3-methyladenine glycosylase II
VKKTIALTDAARNFFSDADPVITRLIEQYGVISYDLEVDHFKSLCSTIVGQQLSGAVADIIWERFLKLTAEGEFSPKAVISLNDGDIRAAGLSLGKCRYVKNLAEAFIGGTLTPSCFDKMSDGKIIERLVEIKGIGAWTAEMFCIFSLGREDVFSEGDGGLSRALNTLYGGGVEFSKTGRAEFAKRWSPYRSIASLYLWKSLNNK